MWVPDIGWVDKATVCSWRNKHVENPSAALGLRVQQALDQQSGRRRSRFVRLDRAPDFDENDSWTMSIDDNIAVLFEDPQDQRFAMIGRIKRIVRRYGNGGRAAYVRPVNIQSAKNANPPEQLFFNCEWYQEATNGNGKLFLYGRPDVRAEVYDPDEVDLNQIIVRVTLSYSRQDNLYKLSAEQRQLIDRCVGGRRFI